MKFLPFLLLVLSTFVNGFPYPPVDQCPTMCTAQYDPVCAIDFNNPCGKPRVFSNSCGITVYNCLNRARYVKVDMICCSKS